jgi:hypothetical protein
MTKLEAAQTVFVVAWKLHKTFGILHQDDLSHPNKRDVLRPVSMGVS